jgi:hypothetical protein
VDEVVDAGGVGSDEIDTPEAMTVSMTLNSTIWPKSLPSVRVASREAHEAVGEVVLRDKAAELAAHVRRVAHGAIPVTDDGLGDQGSEVVVVLPADTLDSDGNVGSRHCVVADSDLGADEVRLLLLLHGRGLGGPVRGFRGDVGEVLLGELDKLLVGNATGTHENHAVGGVVGLDVVLEVGALDALNVLLGAQDGAAKSLALEGGSVEVVEDDFLELLVNLLLLAKYDVPLALDGRGLELGVLQNVGEDVDRLRHVTVEGLGVVDGVFALALHQHACRAPFSAKRPTEV